MGMYEWSSLEKVFVGMPPVVAVAIQIALIVYLISEVLFYFYFRWHLIPCANILGGSPSDIYYDYPNSQDRIQLCRRILLRLIAKADRVAKRTGQDVQIARQNVIREYLLAWFESVSTSSESQKRNIISNNNMDNNINHAAVASPSKQTKANIIDDLSPRLQFIARTTSSTSNSSTESSGSSSTTDCVSVASGASSSHESCSSGTASLFDEYAASPSVAAHSSTASPTTKDTAVPLWTIPGLKAREFVDFVAWAFFAKDTPDLTTEEQMAMDTCFESLEELFGLVVDESPQKPLYYPRRLSLEKVQALHRPWLVYALMGFSHLFQRLFLLPWLGFQKVTAANGKLTAWYRPASLPENQKQVCLFFHGLAPSGVICYLPMLHALLHERQQGLLLFENPSITCQFHALPEFLVMTELEMVQGIFHILDQLQLSTPQHSLTLMGHSFGSCPVTWILRRRQQLQSRIQHVVLLDPVTVLLSEPTVMTRFLYDKEDNNKAHIRFLVATELFTEYYLRRHFCWYNCELWLEDFCDTDKQQFRANGDCNNPEKWTIVLSGRDEIVPSPTVQEHIEWLQRDHNLNNCELVYWPHAKHANCVMSPLRWKMMKNFLFCTNSDKMDQEKKVKLE